MEKLTDTRSSTWMKAMHLPQSKVAVAEMKSNGSNFHSSKQAAQKALADSIDCTDLEEALAETIWKSFVL